MKRESGLWNATTGAGSLPQPLLLRLTRLAADPSAIGKHYVPEDDGVIAMSRLVKTKEQYSIYFRTPEEAGEYPFICTFPGHWMIMRGILEIVEE